MTERIRNTAGTSLRINAYLAAAGLGSRRKVEQLVRDGRIAINALVVHELMAQVDPARDRVTCDGVALHLAGHRYLMLHKPAGYTCTHRDPHARHTIYDLLPPWLHHLNYAGRLDVESEGMLLLSNDGGWLQRVSHPRHQARKTYEVDVRGQPAAAGLEEARRGVRSAGEILRVDSIRILGRTANGTSLLLSLREGKKREIRRIFDALQHPVTRLKRVTTGALQLGGLGPGRWRELTPAEVRFFQEPAGSR